MADMKNLLASIAISLALAFASTAATAQTYVHGYTKKDGTYVAPHYRSSPNNTVRDNYSYKGNVNPYTGAVGTNPYRSSPTSEYYQGSRTPRSTYQTTPRSSYSNPYSTTPPSTYSNPYGTTPPSSSTCTYSTYGC